MKHITLNIYYSRRDRAGNNYFAFTVFDHESEKATSGTVSGGESNIRAAEYALRDRWPNTGEPRWFVNVIELPIRKFNALTKGWPYAGCAPAEILAYMQRGLSMQTAA